ncbi:MAG: ABC transporter substrate-binding protein [Rickettsiales bacterium]|nr:ABC transporter substrate-binding protein [Rickettsiales bacterium]
MKKLLIFILIICLPVFADEPKKLTVILDWTINPNHAPIFVAQKEGFFKRQGLRVELISPADVSSGEKMVAVNKADIAITYQPKLTQLVAQGLPIIRFATLIDKPLNCFVTLDNGSIQSIKDLKDKNIGVSTQNLENSILLSTMLHNANLTIKDINPIYVKFNLMSALLSNKIDGFSGGMRNVEPLAIESVGSTTKLFYPEEYGFPEYDELIFVANKNKMNDPALIKFVYALKQALVYLRNNPEKTWQDFSVHYPALNNTLNKKIWFTTLKYFAVDPAKLENAKYEKLTKFLWNKGVLKTMPKIEEYACEL